jgi:hypothetical protein
MRPSYLRMHSSTQRAQCSGDVNMCVLGVAAVVLFFLGVGGGCPSNPNTHSAFYLHPS